jgi:hypothetical protein
MQTTFVAYTFILLHTSCNPGHSFALLKQRKPAVFFFLPPICSYLILTTLIFCLKFPANCVILTLPGMSLTVWEKDELLEMPFLVARGTRPHK